MKEIIVVASLIAFGYSHIQRYYQEAPRSIRKKPIQNIVY